MEYALGLDIGTNSVGWALVDLDAKDQPMSIRVCGSRIFTASIDDKTKTPLNQSRRNKRLLRRQLFRRRQRRDLVRNTLVHMGMLPSEIGLDPHGAAGWWNAIGDVWELRAAACERPLSLVEIGRIFLAIAKRRGFQSNRKGGPSKGDETEQTQTAQGIQGLRDELEAKGCPTLGSFVWLHGQRSASGLTVRNRGGVHQIWTDRKMMRDEFEYIWDKQRAHYPEIMTPAAKVKLYRAIFWQRPLRAPKRSDDGCAFEPPRKFRDKLNRERVQGVPRAAMGWPDLQRMRLWQRINDLRWRDPLTLQERPLTPDQRMRLAVTLDTQASLTWGKIRKLLGLHKGCAINLEAATDDKGLRGNTTAVRLREHLGPCWDALDQLICDQGSSRLQGQFNAEYERRKTWSSKWQMVSPEALQIAQDLLVTDLLTIDDHPTDGPISLERRLNRDWGFSPEIVDRLLRTELEQAPGRVSLKAARKLLPYLVNGLNLHDAAQSAGYVRRDQELFAAQSQLGPPPAVRNPVVSRALHEVRRVVNAIVRRYGTPQVVRVEMAREASQSARQRSESERRRKNNEKANQEAEDWWKAQVPGKHPRRDDKVAFRLWKQQDHKCLYTGQCISATQLVDGSCQIDHILPYSRSLDDSFGNKAVVFADANQQKGNRSVREWLDPQSYAALVASAKHMRQLPRGTLRRLTAETCDAEDFLARNLVDTQWINRVVIDYLQPLWSSHDLSHKHHMRVEAPRGGTTAVLRHRWGMDGILGGETAKNRSDHRHHALDAIVLACTTRRVYQQAAAGFEHHGRALDVVEPWPNFRSDVAAALAPVIVSHAVDHRIRGAFHEDTGFGRIYNHDDGERFVSRCAISVLTTAKIAKIIDPVVRGQVATAVEKHGSIKAAVDQGVFMPDGITPIRRVRVDGQLKEGSLYAVRQGRRNIRYHQLRNNHRLELLQCADGRLRVRLVRMFDHARMVRLWERAVRNGENPMEALPSELQRLRNGTEGALVLALHGGDAVGFEGLIYRVASVSAAGNQPDVELRLHSDASKAKDGPRLRIRNCKQLVRIHRITINVLGEVHDDHSQRGSGEPRPPAPG